MGTHDPRQVIEDLRNHLAAYDRRLSFLFGAGTSSAVNIAPTPPAGEKPTYEPLIPGIDGLTEICCTDICDMGSDETAAWDTLIKQCEENGKNKNVETILSMVRMKIDAIGEGETLLGFDREKLCCIESAICSTIAK